MQRSQLIWPQPSSVAGRRGRQRQIAHITWPAMTPSTYCIRSPVRMASCKLRRRRAAWGSVEVVWKTGGSASHQSKSQRPITWFTCHVIGAWSRDAERPSFHGNAGCYQGNNHRYHGNHGLNSKQDLGPPVWGGAQGYSIVYRLLVPPPAGWVGGWRLYYIITVSCTPGWGGRLEAIQ